MIGNEMAVQEVNKKLLRELEAMGFPLALATKALHYSGTLNDAVNWVIDHENDSNVDNMHDVLINIDVEAPKQFEITEAMMMKAQELRDRVRKKNEEKKLERQREKKKEEKKSEREREKERIRAGKEFNNTKRIAEENERKRNLDLWKAEKEEEKRAREKILKKLEQDKRERRGKLGLPVGGPAAVKPPTPVMQDGKNSFPVKSVIKAEPMRDCLRSLKRNHKHDDARVKRAFQTLMIYVGNVMRNPNEEKFRKIRLGNPLFQDRVGRLKGGVEFLELCGFEIIERDGDEFLFLPRDKVDMPVLNSAGSGLRAALTNPFFGLLQRED